MRDATVVHRMAQNLVWAWYLLTVSIAAAVFGGATPDGDRVTFVAIQLGLLGALLVLVAIGRPRGASWNRAARGAYTVLAMPTAFSSLGLILPQVHPEPFEWTWMALDRALLGCDPTVSLQGLLTPLLTELLQWIYASFYLIPIVTVAAIGLHRGAAAFDRALLTVTFAFLLSYLGYFLWPTLPPYRFLPHEGTLEGVWLASDIHAMLDAAELHRWDCFPSGHTMLTLVSVVLAWREVRRLACVLMPIAALLVLSTMALRYHYAVDVLAGVVLVLPSVWLGRRLAPAA